MGSDIFLRNVGGLRKAAFFIQTFLSEKYLMTITDLIVIVLSAFYFWNGWRKGFLHSLLGPASVVVCFGAAFLYYQQTHNIFVSFMISCFGPIAVKYFNKT